MPGLRLSDLNKETTYYLLTSLTGVGRRHRSSTSMATSSSSNSSSEVVATWAGSTTRATCCRTRRGRDRDGPFRRRWSNETRSPTSPTPRRIRRPPPVSSQPPNKVR